MRCGPASLLVHDGWGRPHLDLLLADGHRCTTLALALPLPTLAGRLRLRSGQWWPQAPHRRFYLDYSGPVAGGRGRVRCLWQGRARWHRAGAGRCIHLPGLRLELLAPRGLLAG